MTPVTSSSFPEYSREHLTADCRAHLLGAASCWKEAHEALLRDDKRRALVEIEKCLVIAGEARKFLLGQATPPPANAEPQLPLESGPKQCQIYDPTCEACQ